MFAELQDRTSNTSEHLNLAQNRTSNLPNITKTRTVREHRTVRSKTSTDSTQKLGVPMAPWMDPPPDEGPESESIERSSLRQCIFFKKD